MVHLGRTGPSESLIAARDLSQDLSARQRGDPRPAGHRTSTSRRAISWRSWGRAARARRRCSTCSAGSTCRRRGSITVAGDEITHLSGGEADALARAPRGLHLPDVQPDPGADGVPQRRAAAAADAALEGRAQAARGDGAAAGRPRRSHAATSPRELSGGQQQRVAIARAIVADPDVPALRRADGRPRPQERRRDPRPARAAGERAWARRC